MTGNLIAKLDDRTRLIGLLLFFLIVLKRMEKKVTAKQKKVDDLVSNLSSQDEKVVVKAIKSLKTNGNETAIEPLVSLLSRTESESVKNEVTDL